MKILGNSSFFFENIFNHFIKWAVWSKLFAIPPLGPVVQSVVSLTSSLVVKMLTVLVSTISNSHVFLLKKCEMQKLLTFFFRKNISIYGIFNDQSFNDTLTNNIVSFEQLGPDCQIN